MKSYKMTNLPPKITAVIIINIKLMQIEKAFYKIPQYKPFLTIT